MGCPSKETKQMARLTLAFLGAFQASIDALPLQLRSARLQALLAYLALEAVRPHTREALAALFWPDESDQVAKQNLRQALYQLRQLLGEQAEPFLLVTRDTVQFNPAGSCALDVSAFMRYLKHGQLQEAAELYQGELLAQLTSGSDSFEEWLVLRREQLHILAVDALHQLAEQALAGAENAQAQLYARRQLALEPWREQAHRQLMLALARSGDRSAALAQYETCRRVLADELGVEPERETSALYEQIRANQLRIENVELRNASTLDSTFSILHSQFHDLADAPDVDVFYGRERELELLEQWLIGERCRVIGVLGMGGLGKTALAARLVRRCAERFEYVIWRSLLNAPGLSELLGSWLRVLSDQQLARLPDGLDAQLGLLFDYLRRSRCLLILDNAESIMQGGERAGYCRAGYEEYGQLLLRMGQSSHQSCLVITSREQPRELARLVADTPLVRSLALAGLGLDVGGELLSARGLIAPGASSAALVQRYSGNPLALKLVAEAIQDLFAGDIDAFLGDDAPIFDDIRDVLDQQFARLAPLERDLLLWLAIAREPLAEAQLWQLCARTASKRAFLEALRSLQRRSLLESYALEHHGGAFGLQNVLTEYLTDYLIGQVCRELEGAAPAFLHSHALILAHAKEYVRQSQERVILQPVAERLLAAGGRAPLEARCKQLLESMRRDHPLQPSFLAGNLLNLLLHLQISLRGYDVSDLSVWQAYLRGADLPALDLSHADLSGSVFTDYAGAVTAVAFSPDGRLLAAGADSGAIYLWRVPDRQLIGICQGHTSHVWSLAFGGLPDAAGSLLLSGSGDSTARIWDVEHRQTLRILAGHTAGIASVGFHPSGKVVASGSLDQTARLWDAQSGELLYALQADRIKVEALAFSPDGRTLATGGHDQVVRIWDWRRAELLHTLRGHTNLVKALGFCPCSPAGGAERQLLATGGDDQTLRLWDAQSGELLGCLAGHTAAVISIAWSADGAWLLSGSDDQTARIWDLAPARAGSAGDVQTIRVLHGHYGTLRSLAAHPHPQPGQALIASGSYDKTVRLWDGLSGHTLAIMRGNSKWLQALAFTPADAPVPDRLLVGGSDGQNVRVWDGETGRVLHTLRGHTSLTEKLAFRADGAQFASASWDQTARIWDLQTGQARHVLQAHTGAVATAAIGPGPRGRLIASGGLDRSVRIWDGESGEALACWNGHHDRVVALAFSADGAMLASGSWDSSIGIWDLQRNELVFFLHGHSETVESVAFQPGGNLLASASWDRSVRVWDVRTGQLIHTLRGHSDGLEMVVFSPNGALLASCACDHLVCVWDAQRGRLLYTLRGHASWVRCIAFSPDSGLLASGSDDGTVKLWDVTPAGAGACQRTIAMEEPYAGMNITGATGLTAAQRLALKALGAVEEAG
jgi:WD40 repeat protein/DNA-binding SARP family transcriptional activator